MANKIGICKNLDCANYKQEVEIEPGGEFECPLCHQPLKEAKGGGSTKKGGGPKGGKGWMIVGGVVVAAAVVMGIKFMPNGENSDVQEQDTTVVPAPEPEPGGELEFEDVDVVSMTFMETAQDMKLKKNETKQLNIDCDPGNANESVTWKSGNEAVATVSSSGLVTAVAAGKVTITAVADRSKTKAEIEVVVSDEGNGKVNTSGRGTVNLSYGTYTGELKNGKPHGYGTITYNTSCKIVSSKDFVANPGDTFEGEFRDGKISGLGYWKHGGNTTAVKP